MKDYNPSNSDIKVYSHGYEEGTVEQCFNACLKKSIKLINGRKHIFGQSMEKWMRPRAKGYENHGGLNVSEIHCIYRCFTSEEAYEMEAALIKKFYDFEKNVNIRKESGRAPRSRNKEYFVYLAIE